MSDSWYVFKKNKRLGPMTAVEVRDALRGGSIDPMDLVSREGSSVKIELYEVDEIFAVQGEDSHSNPAETLDAPIALASNDYIRGAASAAAAANAPRKAEAFKAEHTPKPKVKPRNSRRKRDPKKFFLIDRRKRRLGPLSAKEIQSIFYRGIVDQSAKVVKAGTDKKVPVGTFVNVYAGARAAEFKNESTETGFDAYSQTSVAIPSTRVLDEMKRIRDSRATVRNLSSMILPIVGIAFGIALGYWALDRYVLSDNVRQYDEPDYQNYPDEFTNPEPRRQPRSVQKKAPPRKVIKRKPVKKKPKRVVREKKPPRKIKKKPPPRRTAVVRKPKPPPKKKPKVKSRVNPRGKLSRPPVKRSPPKRSVSKPVRKGAVASLSVGSVGTARGMRFSKSALQACGIRCTLVMTDSSGKSLRVVFFKGAWESKLMSSRGSVTISGRVSGTATSKKMMLSNVN